MKMPDYFKVNTKVEGGEIKVALDPVYANPMMDERDFGAVCVCAVRYALGRRTYMPEIIRRFMEANIGRLPNNSIYVMARDIECADDLGDECDAKGWRSLHLLLQNERLKRVMKEADE